MRARVMGRREYASRGAVRRDRQQLRRTCRVDTSAVAVAAVALTQRAGPLRVCEGEGGGGGGRRRGRTPSEAWRDEWNAAECWAMASRRLAHAGVAGSWGLESASCSDTADVVFVSVTALC